MKEELTVTVGPFLCKTYIFNTVVNNSLEKKGDNNYGNKDRIRIL